MENLISEEYQQLLIKKHLHKPWGGTGNTWIPTLLPLLNPFPPGEITMLDYGCGRGTLKRDIEPLHPDVKVTEFDPGVVGKNDPDILKMPVDFVVCTDVMEHVEESKVVETLRTLNYLTKAAVFFNIECTLSKSFLPDGRNTHITIKAPVWWKEMLETYFPDMEWKVHRLTRSQLVMSGWRIAPDV